MALLIGECHLQYIQMHYLQHTQYIEHLQYIDQQHLVSAPNVYMSVNKCAVQKNVFFWALPKGGEALPECFGPF